MSSAEFTREDIESLLEALSARLRARGVAASLYIVGGAAIALRDVSPHRRTGDVDALMVPEEDVLEAAREVAAERAVRSTWLNSSARPYVPPLPEEAKRPPTTEGLVVHLAPEEHLLAMKTIAARGQRDMRDIVPLAHRLGITRAQELVALVSDVYGLDAIEHVHGGLDDLRLHCQAVERVLSVDPD